MTLRKRVRPRPAYKAARETREKATSDVDKGGGSSAAASGAGEDVGGNSGIDEESGSEGSEYRSEI